MGVLNLIVGTTYFNEEKMASSEPVKGVIRHVKPLLSVNKHEARKRVLNLYKTWYKGLPNIIFRHQLPVSFEEARQKLRNDFLKHKHLTDPRAIDMLVFKGQLLYKEVTSKFSQKCHVLYLFKYTELPKPKDFLSKFLSGKD